ncbi:YqaJ viral recombinase family protein [Streptomyces sp. NPDC059218]|uniref:YqaJ viral recombinase family nuclease n=1 Tax=unclassified Streptomyces TaxID=2593676 RepID=UPI003691FF5F
MHSSTAFKRTIPKGIGTLTKSIHDSPETPTARLILPAGASEEEWLAVRRTGIGGSDVAAILGLDKRRGPRKVFEEKHGYREPENTYMRAGKYLEPVIAQWFEDETGLKTVNMPGTFAHIEHDWARANIDRGVLDDAGKVVAPLECKNKSEYLKDEWEDTEEAPDGPALQAHWYAGVCGWSHSYVAALVGGNRLRVFWQERNEELIAELFKKCGEWFERHVIEGFPPPVDGLESTKELLAALWEARPEAVAEIPMDKAMSLRDQRADLKAQIKALESQLTAVENEMRDTAKDAEIVRVGKSTAWTWKANGNFAPSRFQAEQPELAASYMRTVQVVDTDRLKTEQPEIYRQYRARCLFVPKKGL